MLRHRRPNAAQAAPWIAIVLAWCAGFVDTVSYLAFTGIYTSHMTGNTARLGENIVYTTYMAGNLSKFAEGVMHYLFWLRDRTRGRSALESPRRYA